MGRREALDLKVRGKGDLLWELTTDADPDDPDEFRQILLDALTRDGSDDRRSTSSRWRSAIWATRA